MARQNRAFRAHPRCRQISTKELADYVIKRVEELAKARNASQAPQDFKGRDAEDYV